MVPSPQTRPRIVSLTSLALAQVDDASLARAASEGDPRAPGAIWDRFAPTVRRILKRSIGPMADVEDLMQEVFLSLFKQLPTLREVSALRAFIIGICVRVLGTELRRRRVRRFLMLTERGALPEAESLPSDPGARAAVTSLYRILDGLQVETRLIFTLRYLDDLQLTEIASALRVSLATAKRRLAKATTHVQLLVEREPALKQYLDSIGLGGQP